MPNRLRFAGVSVLLAAAGLMASFMGCESGQDPERLRLRSQLILAEEPREATSIAEAQQQLDTRSEVVVVGRVGAGDVEPWIAGEASFLISELPTDDHGHGSGHDADNCPFCKRKAAQAPVAMVQFVDERAAVLAADAQELFGLKRGDVVVVRGRGEWDEQVDLFRIVADGLYLRR
jgi:hypothetical protein